MLHSKSTKDQKTHDNLNSHRKSICQNPTSNPDLKKKKKKKNLWKQETEENFSNLRKAIHTHRHTRTHTHTSKNS